MFRTQENIPEIYVNASRDFQLLCRIKDAVQGALKYNIDSLRHLNNTLEMNSTLLPLLKSKVGFFKEEQLSEDQLRYLLAGFPYLVKYKGSKKAIESAIYLWFRVNRVGGKLISVLIDNTAYEINISIDTPPQDTSLLDALFSYLIPTGYLVSYTFASAFNTNANYTFETQVAELVVDMNENAQIRRLDEDNIVVNDIASEEFSNRNTGAIGTVQMHQTKSKES